jgi:hypothetical protein
VGIAVDHPENAMIDEQHFEIADGALKGGGHVAPQAADGIPEFLRLAFEHGLCGGASRFRHNGRQSYGGNHSTCE